MTTHDDAIELSTDAFPLLGYTVIATLKGIEVGHDELRGLLAPLGLAHYLPALPEARTGLRRAIRAWLHSLAPAAGFATADDDADPQTRTRRLVHEITVPRSQMLILALVAENIDLTALGLSYLTNLRVFCDKTTQTVRLTTTPSGQTDFAGPATAQDQALLAGLRPFWEHYRERHAAGDLSRMVQAIIADLDARTLRPGGGVYFVPAVQRPALQQLQHLIEDVLPAAPGQENESTLVHLPVVDRPATKAHLARLAHSAFQAEVVALRKDLERFIAQAQSMTRRGRPGSIRLASMLSRLAEYAAVRAQVAFYCDALGMRDEEILRHVARLEATARLLLASATRPEEGNEPVSTGPAAERQAAHGPAGPPHPARRP